MSVPVESRSVDPNSNSVASVKPVPITCTDVPPAVGPLSGSTWVTTGGAVGVTMIETVPVATWLSASAAV